MSAGYNTMIQTYDSYIACTIQHITMIQLVPSCTLELCTFETRCFVETSKRGDGKLWEQDTFGGFRRIEERTVLELRGTASGEADRPNLNQ